jgi:dTDP-glucose pyrophosphorylase
VARLIAAGLGTRLEHVVEEAQRELEPVAQVAQQWELAPG